MSGQLRFATYEKTERVVVFVGELPKTVSGKIIERELRDRRSDESSEA